MTDSEPSGDNGEGAAAAAEKEETADGRQQWPTAAAGAADFGSVDELPHGVTKRGGLFIYSRSLDHPGHVYRWSPHCLKENGGVFSCQNCRKIRKMAGGGADHTVTLVSVRNGRFTTSPDRPKNPHVCTIAGGDGTFDMFTLVHMYAEQFVAKIKEDVHRQADLGVPPRQAFDSIVGQLDAHVPAEFAADVRATLPEFRALRSSLMKTRQKRQAKALLDAAMADGGGDPLLATTADNEDGYEPQCSQLQHSMLPYVGTGSAIVTGADPVLGAAVQPSSAAIQIGVAPVKRPPAEPAAGGADVVGGKRAKQESARREREACVRDAKNKVRIAALRTTLRSSGAAAAGGSGTYVDGTLKRALQQATLKHEMRLFAIKERSAERAARYEEEVYRKELRQKDAVDRANAEHQRECNRLARRRMELENELIEARAAKLRAETKQIDAGKAIVKVECGQADNDNESSPSHSADLPND